MTAESNRGELPEREPAWRLLAEYTKAKQGVDDSDKNKDPASGTASINPSPIMGGAMRGDIIVLGCNGPYLRSVMV